MSRRAIGRNYVETFGNRASHAAFAELEPSLNYSEPSGNLGGMGHSITSFVLMRERGLSAALTTDRHFEQAGLTRLLKP